MAGHVQSTTAHPPPIEFAELPLEPRAQSEVIVLPALSAELTESWLGGAVQLIVIAVVCLLLGYLFGSAIR